MRKIGDVASGPFEIECVLVEKRIEFHDKRRDFTWLRARYSPGSAGANALQVLNQLRQWRQSESNLDQDAAYEREGEEAKRPGSSLRARGPGARAGKPKLQLRRFCPLTGTVQSERAAARPQDLFLRG
jgi:hypothetical protein